MQETTVTVHLKDLWDDKKANDLSGNQLSLLRYRSNLLGADLRITNFGGGNTSSKIELPDPFTRKPTRVLAVKGSGGDLGSITEAGFALLYQDRLEQLKALYKDEAHEDEMVGCYLSSIHTIDQMGEFIAKHQNRSGPIFGGLEYAARPDRWKVVAEILPALRGALSSNRRALVHYSDQEDALVFAGSKWSREL